MVVAIATTNDVVTSTTKQHVVAAATIDDVVARVTGQSIYAAVATNRVISGRTINIFKVRNAVIAIAADCTAFKVYAHAVGISKAKRIFAVTTIKRVIPGTTGNIIVASPGQNRLVAVAANHDIIMIRCNNLLYAANAVCADILSCGGIGRKIDI